MSWQAALASGVGPQASSAVYRSGTRGGVATVKGCVGDATSPGTLLAGTGRSSTGKIGVPVVRSRMYSIPDLPVWMTAGILAPSCVTVTHDGECGRRGVVEIPEVVVYGLEVPHDFPRGCAQGHDRAGVAVVAQ